MGFHGEALLAPRPTPKQEGHPLSAVFDCLFNLFTATLHIGGRSSIRNLRTRHAVVTGTRLSHGTKIYRLYKCTDNISGIEHDVMKVYETAEIHMSQLFDVLNRCERLLSSFGLLISDRIVPVTISNIISMWRSCNESAISMAQSPSLAANKPLGIHEIPRI